ncbi:MAG: leucine-rich repeat domain-containing protein [Crocinitomicaceae bacterium]|nr:leucine-rich repeat domain-containing protein [Crocinitomicaceae bacterium]
MKICKTIILLVCFHSFSFATRVTDLKDIQGKEGSITEIDLSYQGLTVFPSEILLCSNLQVLNLSNNGIMKLPAGLAQLKNLKYLDLSSNQGLSASDLNEVFETATFNLSHLDLSSCGLLNLPENLGKQKNLTTCLLSNNRLTNLPYSMMELSNLKTIDISQNELHEMGWVTGYWWSLKKIYLDGNTAVKTSAVLFTLSFFDKLDELTISHVDYFPKDFSLLNTHKLTVKNSTIREFPRAINSTPIQHLVFDACIFEKPDVLVDLLNTYSNPGQIEFHNIPADQLVPFLDLKTDSITLVNCGTFSLAPLAKNKSVKFIDLRNNPLPRNEVDAFAESRPDIELLSREPITPNVGISPPFEQFVEAPQQTTFVAGKDIEVDLGIMDLKIPANALVDQNGNYYTGEVQMEYQTYSNPAEIFFSGITMTATEDGETMLFSSGGMFSIEATDNQGNPLFINPEQPIEVNMNSMSANPGMSLYQLDENGVWQLKGENEVVQPFKYDQEKLDSILAIDFKEFVFSQIQFQTDRFIPVVKWDHNYESFSITFRKFSSSKHKSNDNNEDYMRVFEPDYVGNFFGSQKLIFEGDSAKYYFNFLDSLNEFCEDKYERLRIPKTKIYRRTGPNYLANIELIPDHENDRFLMSFLFKDTVISLPVNTYPKELTSSQKMNESKLFYKRFLRHWKLSRRLRAKNRNRLKSEIIRRANELKKRAIEEEKARQELRATEADYLNSYAGEGSVVRAFQIDGFGVWNCDIRSRMLSPTNLRREFITKSAGDLMQADSKEIIIIDHDKNSVINFPPGSEAFFDKGSKTTIAVMLSSVLVGIYHSWINRRDNGICEIELLNIENMNKSSFANFLIHAE